MFGTAQKIIRMWECKDCHKEVSDEETMAYRLINGIMYGWCEACYAGRHAAKQ